VDVRGSSGGWKGGRRVRFASGDGLGLLKALAEFALPALWLNSNVKSKHRFSNSCSSLSSRTKWNGASYKTHVFRERSSGDYTGSLALRITLI